jgi:HPt (histidine-containing phosphotransfer) domain-containing protein
MQDPDAPFTANSAHVTSDFSNNNSLLSAAREAYRRRLTLLAVEVASSCARAEKEPDALNHLRTMAHRLTGTAGSYGFADISAAAEELHRRLAESTPWYSIAEVAGCLIKRMQEAGADRANSE